MLLVRPDARVANIEKMIDTLSQQMAEMTVVLNKSLVGS